MKTYLCVYLGSALVAIVAVPAVAWAARRLGLMDMPGVRKVHRSPVPRIGGVAIMLAMLALTIPVLLLNNSVGQALRDVQTRVVTLLAASVFVFLVGLADDLRNVSAPIKLLALVAASLAICLSGARIDSIALDPLFVLKLGWAAWPVTVLWIVAITVAMNFIDGLDGLAAGIAVIVCGVIAALAYHSGQIVMAVLMLALMGSLTGFLFFNFNPARIFMGDCGSMFLGFLIGAGSVACQAKTCTLVGIALPALALGVPLLDAVLTVVRRGVLDRRSIFVGEKGHIHHRLLALGLNQRRAVLVVYGVTLLASGIGLLMLVTRQAGTILVALSVLLVLVLVFHRVGATRLRETLAALRRNSAIAHQARQEKSCFEDMQLRMREATSFDGWWGTVCSMAERMGFDRLALSLSQNGQSRTTVWCRGRQELSPQEVIQLSIPLGAGGNGQDGDGNGNGNGNGDGSGDGNGPGGHEGQTNDSPFFKIEVAVKVNGSLEAFGRRVMFFGRLIDEHGVAAAASLPGSALQAPAGCSPVGEGDTGDATASCGQDPPGPPAGVGWGTFPRRVSGSAGTSREG